MPGRIVADLRIARGLDYYTGTVYETELVGFESWGAIASGGRYDSLASDGRTTYPGVGLSIGVTRLLAPLLGPGAGWSPPGSVPTVVLVAVESEEHRADAVAVAEHLRSPGIATEVVAAGRPVRPPDPLCRPARHPVRLVRSGADSEVKDIRTGEQVPADAGGGRRRPRISGRRSGRADPRRGEWLT